MDNIFNFGNILFDSHCHLNDESFDSDIESVIQSAIESDVEKILDIGIDPESSKKAVENARKFEGVYASVGIDPDIAIPTSELYQPDLDIEEEIGKLKNLAEENSEYVVAIGESGMDNYWLGKAKDSKELSPEEAESSLSKQEDMFRLHLELALELRLPLSVHSRAAEERCLKIIADYPAAQGIFHSFTGSYEQAKKVLDQGWALGMNGIVTFKNAEELRSVYKKVLGKVSSDWSPKDFYSKGVYFETDAPYLSPAGKRGSRNEPSNVKTIYDHIKGIHQVN